MCSGSRSSNTDSVPEVAHAGEHHRQPVFVGGGDHFGIAHRTAGLDDRLDACFGGGIAIDEDEIFAD